MKHSALVTTVIKMRQLLSKTKVSLTRVCLALMVTFFTPMAFAQGGDVAAPNPLLNLMPIVFVFVIFYFLVLRPQNTARKNHMEMIKNVRRGDVVVTGGGLVGKVTKVLDDNEVMVELADKVAVKVVRSSLSDVRTKPEPAANDK